MTVLSIAIFCTTKNKIRRQFPQTQQKGYLCRRKKNQCLSFAELFAAGIKALCIQFMCELSMKLILLSVQWPPEKSLLGARNVPEVASSHTVFQNVPYPALSLTRLPPWQPNSAPPTL